MAKKKVFKTAPKPASNDAFKQDAAKETEDNGDPNKKKKGGLQAWLAKSKLAKTAKASS